MVDFLLQNIELHIALISIFTTELLRKNYEITPGLFHSNQ
jgi:hypothetical protein